MQFLRSVSSLKIDRGGTFLGSDETFRSNFLENKIFISHIFYFPSRRLFLFSLSLFIFCQAHFQKKKSKSKSLWCFLKITITLFTVFAESSFLIGRLLKNPKPKSTPHFSFSGVLYFFACLHFTKDQYLRDHVDFLFFRGNPQKDRVHFIKILIKNTTTPTSHLHSHFIKTL